MRTLAKDKRGYPVPFLVVVDKSGLPQFTINDVRKVQQCIGKKLCAICGKRFDRNPVSFKKDEMWFVGGSRCFTHQHGAFLDPPAHLECAEYALRVCPFLAAPHYSGRIDTAKLKEENLPDGMAVVRTDYMPPQLPERFGLGLCHSYRITSPNPGGVMFLVDDWRYIEWWREGERINAPDTAEPIPDPRVEAA